MTSILRFHRFFRAASVAFTAIAAVVTMTSTASAAQKAPSAQPQLTFTKDVAPILQRSCVTCHRPGDIAPMSLMTYEEARPWVRSIRAKVSTREMPPWHIDRNVGIQKFKDDPSLSDEEIATIVKWADSGAPMGNPADMPAQRQFADATQWLIGKPDLVVKYPNYKLASSGPDVFDTWYADPGMKEDRYIKAIQSRAVGEASRKVIHHAITSLIDKDDDRQSDGSDTVSEGAQLLVEYTSGKGPVIYPDDSGVLMKANKRFSVGTHLHPVGEEVNVGLEVGLVFYPKGVVPKHLRWERQMGYQTMDLDIPPGTVVRRDGYAILQNAMRLTAFQPHMHIRGKYQCLEVIYPTAGAAAKTELLSCANFNYNWHQVYNYADDAAPLLPKGTIMHIMSWEDNSTANKFNPDPKNWVGDGNRTIDEMTFAWLGWYDLTDEEYKQELAARKSEQRQKISTQQQQPPQHQQ